MPFLPSHYAMVMLFGWSGIQLFRSDKPKKRPSKKPPPEPPTDQPCGHFVWNALDVDVALQGPLDDGERDPETLALIVARAVYASRADGSPQVWPAAASDEPATCIYAWIVDHIRTRLTDLGDDPPEPTTDDPEEPEEPELPRPPRQIKPVDLGRWTDPGNYPTPGMFYQVGGEDSPTSLQAIARQALTTAFYLALNDLERAKELARKRDHWEYYREAINCVPWNHALFGSASTPGSSGYYPTPHGDSISMFPVHAKVADQLARGETPTRRVRTGSRARPTGGRHAFLWLPLLDEDALRDGRVVLTKEQWPNGDSAVMPPPEVTALGLANLPFGRTWGCLGHLRTTEEF